MPIPAGKSSLALFTPSEPGTYSFYCRPQTDNAAFAFLVSRLLIGFFALQTRILSVAFGIEMLAAPISQRFGLDAALAATVPRGVVNRLEVLASYWL